jgi:predicted metallopeptidase
MDFNFAPDIDKKIKKILPQLPFKHIDSERIVCFRSQGSKARAYARIWSLPRIWQKALQVEAHYCIEVLSEKFDKLCLEKQTKVLIHELMHIPKTFSGALLPHKGRGRVKIDGRTVNKIFKQFLKGAD